MRKTIKRTLGSAIIGLAGFCALTAISSPVLGQKITRENGVEVVSNPKAPVIRKGVPSTPVLKEDLLIGVESGDPNSMFSELRSIQVDDEGAIYALDSKDTVIRVFDQKGVYLRTFGKKGQGPAEWDDPSRLFLTPSGELMVLDSGNNKISFFSRAGQCLRETPLGKYQLIRAFVDEKNRIYGDFLVPKESSYTISLARFDSRMNLETIVAEPASHKIDPHRYTLLLDRLIYKPLGRDRLAWAYTRNYEISIVQPEKGTVRKIIKAYDKQKLTDEDKKDEIKSSFGDKPPEGLAVVFPEYYSPLFTFTTGDDEFLYVQTNEKDAAGRVVYDVFDAGGVLTARFSLPQSELLFVARGGKLYCLIEANEAGIPQIKRYSLEWK